jgi:phage-related protein
LHKIRFYKDRNGRQPVKEHLDELKKKNDKSSRIRLNKANDYIQALAEYGTAIGEPYLKKIDDKYNIWELRPSSDRIFFVAWVNDSYMLLHVFQKKTQKTPEREKAQARREVKDLLERGQDHEE